MTEILRLVAPKANEALLACSLSRWSGMKGLCCWCNAPLGPCRRRWCSDACSGAHAMNHYWSVASYWAKVRDGHRCVACTSQRRIEVHHLTPLSTLMIEMPVWQLEPRVRKARHADPGCWHHQDGLQTLCMPCHKVAHRDMRVEVARPSQLALEVA